MTTTATTQQEAPISVTDLVKAVAAQEIATPEQVAELAEYFGAWIYQTGDAIDRELSDAVDAVANCVDTVGLDQDQVDWFDTATPDQLEACGEGWTRKHAEAELAKSVAAELEARREVVRSCGQIVHYGEHGSDARERRLAEIWDAEYSMWAD